MTEPEARAYSARKLGSHADIVFNRECKKLGIVPADSLSAPLLVIAVEREGVEA